MAHLVNIFNEVNNGKNFAHFKDFPENTNFKVVKLFTCTTKFGKSVVVETDEHLFHIPNRFVKLFDTQEKLDDWNRTENLHLVYQGIKGTTISINMVVPNKKARRRDKELCADEPKFYLEESVLENKLPEITFRSLIELPSGLDYNEWLASHTIAIFDNVNLMYGTISEFCTATGCPDMVGPGFRTYLWFDDKGKKTRVSAPQYVDYVMTFTQKTINDEGVFPTKYPHEFPSSFETIVRKILRLLFHVLAHLYHSHFREMVMLNLHSHLNSVFTHLIILNDCYHLIDDRELEILFDLVHALKILESDTAATKSSETSRSSVTNGCLSSDNSANKQVESADTKSSEQLASYSDPNFMLPATGNVANDASATEVVNFSC